MKNGLTEYESKLAVRAAGIMSGLNMQVKSTCWSTRAVTKERAYVITFYNTNPDVLEKAATGMKHAFRRARVLHGKQSLHPGELPTQFIILTLNAAHHKKCA